MVGDVGRLGWFVLASLPVRLRHNLGGSDGHRIRGSCWLGSCGHWLWRDGIGHNVCVSVVAYHSFDLSGGGQGGGWRVMFQIREFLLDLGFGLWRGAAELALAPAYPAAD